MTTQYINYGLNGIFVINSPADHLALPAI